MMLLVWYLFVICLVVNFCLLSVLFVWISYSCFYCWESSGSDQPTGSFPRFVGAELALEFVTTAKWGIGGTEGIVSSIMLTPVTSRVIGASKLRGQKLVRVTSASFAPEKRLKSGLKNIAGLPSKLESQTNRSIAERSAPHRASKRHFAR